MQVWHIVRHAKQAKEPSRNEPVGQDVQVVAVSQAKQVGLQVTTAEVPVSKKLPMGTEQIEIEPLGTSTYGATQPVQLRVMIEFATTAVHPVQNSGHGTQVPLDKT